MNRSDQPLSKQSCSGSQPMRKEILFSVWLMVMGFVRAGVADQEVPAEAQPDWQVIIAQLRQQLHRMPGHAVTRQQLATAYNNYAVSLADQGRFVDATQHLEEAMRLDPSNAQFRNNLVTIYLRMAQLAFQEHRLQDAKDAINHALALDPKETTALTLLGEIEYHSQRLNEAKHAWQQALAINPALREVQEKLTQLNQELPVELQFERLSQAYFDIRYPEEFERPIGFDIRDALLQARRVIGSDFAFWPKHKLIVLVYSTEQFRQLRQNTPDWVVGQYDGKIRVRLPMDERDRDGAVRTLVHEYTHAIVHDLTHGRLPTWFNEGLAEYEAWKSQAPAWPILRQAFVQGHLIPWTSLSTQFSPALQAQEVVLAYEESHSIVRYLVERYGFWRIRRLLKAVDNQTPFEEALTAELHVKLNRLEADWLKWLEKTLASH